MPASTPALISSVCASVAAAITIPSTPLPISASGRVRGLGAEPFGDRRGDRGHRIGDDEGVDLVEVGQGVGVERADPAESDQTETHDGLLCDEMVQDGWLFSHRDRR